MKTRIEFVLCLVVGCLLHPALFAQDGFELPLDHTVINRDDPKYLTSYAPVLKPAKEAVVAVHSARILKVIRSNGMDPREEFMRRFFGLPAPQRSAPEVEERRLPEGIGSGVVISPDGYILTNNHVVSVESGDPADELLVELNDGRELKADLVGRDPQSDLAVLKVDAKDLPHLPIADSDQLEVGDIVFAIGNPMGVGLTITQGIVSATGRSNLSILGDAGYESFIQTDAPINPGNSGGALVDAYGRLVGINTAILSKSGGSIGIGFAIPSAFARKIALTLVKDGAVRRGVLGVNVGDLTADLVEAFSLPNLQGALVQSVIKDLPADLAGLRQGDVVTAIDGVPVRNAAALRMRVAEFQPGSTVEVDYLRDGKAARLSVALGDPGDPYGLGAMVGEWLDGVDTAVLNDHWRRELGLDARLEGLLVVSVRDDSPYAGVFTPGSVILEINDQTPKSVDDAVDLIKMRKISRLYIYFKGRSGYLSIRVD